MATKQLHSATGFQPLPYLSSPNLSGSPIIGQWPHKTGELVEISSLENAPMHNCDFCSIMQKICNDNNFPHCTPLWEFIILWVWLAWEGTSDWRIGWTKCLCLTYMCQIIFWNQIKPENSSLLSIRCCLSAGCAKRIGTEMKLHNRPNRPTNRPTKTGFLRYLLYQAK